MSISLHATQYSDKRKEENDAVKFERSAQSVSAKTTLLLDQCVRNFKQKFIDNQQSVLRIAARDDYRVGAIWQSLC